jgi:hypothetical protein
VAGPDDPALDGLLTEVAVPPAPVGTRGDTTPVDSPLRTQVITTFHQTRAVSGLESRPMRLRMGAVIVVGAAFLAIGASAAAIVPKPFAGRCTGTFAVFLRPAGRLDVYRYDTSEPGNPKNSFVLLATATARGGSVSGACPRVKAQTPPVRPQGLAGPWPRSVESRILCWYGATVQIRPIVKQKRVTGTRLLVMRSEVDPADHDKDFLQGRHVIVDAFLKAGSGGISFDTEWCSRNRFP